MVRARFRLAGYRHGAASNNEDGLPLSVSTFTLSSSYVHNFS